MGSARETNQEKLEKALMCMQSALQMLDDADAPAEIGALLDLAICTVQDRLSDSRAVDPPDENSRERT